MNTSLYAQAASSPASDQQGKTILIVDDEAIIRDLCSKALRGYRLLNAGDGQEALAVFENEQVDVILTDVMMPRMNGIELLKKAKEIDPTLVVIIMTGFAEKDVILNALKADADDFISKPLNLLQLKTAIDKALVKKQLKEELASLRYLDRLKTDFLSIISHKFRTPITAISLFLQNLASGMFEPEDESFIRNVEMVYKESCHLEGLVAELLRFSKVMTSGEGLRLEPCDINPTIMQALAESKEMIGKIGVKTELDLKPTDPIPMDREKISFAIRQIIENAYKFIGDKGTVAVSLHQEQGQIIIKVADSGIGISKEELPKIFEKFYQVDPAKTGQVRGFGLGLYYAREFVRLHGGAITIESEPSKGTKVTISLPIPNV